MFGNSHSILGAPYHNDSIMGPKTYSNYQAPVLEFSETLQNPLKPHTTL